MRNKKPPETVRPPVVSSLDSLGRLVRSSLFQRNWAIAPGIADAGLDCDKLSVAIRLMNAIGASGGDCIGAREIMKS